MDKQQLRQKVANMEAELAEMKALLNKPEPTINYWQPSETEPDYYYISTSNTILVNTLNPKNDRSTRYRVFKTEAEAQKYTDYVKAEETLKKAIAEANESWLPNWDYSDEYKHIVSLQHSYTLNVLKHYTNKQQPNFMYIKSEELAEQLAAKYRQEFITYLSY